MNFSCLIRTRSSDGKWRRVTYVRDGVQFSVNVTRIDETVEGLDTFSTTGSFDKDLSGILKTGGLLYLGGTLTVPDPLQNEERFPQELYSGKITNNFELLKLK